jgi:hypothetical protein
MLRRAPLFGGITAQNFDKQAEGGWWCFAASPAPHLNWAASAH